MRTVAVVGGGLGGLSCARELVARGREVVVFDKGHAPGGRLLGRRCGSASCDVGASYFTARDPRFVAVVREWEQAGRCARWDGRIGATDGNGHFTVPTPTVRHVGMPRMSALVTDLAHGLDVREAHRVDGLRLSGRALLLDVRIAADGRTLPPSSHGTSEDTRTFGPFDAVAVCLPAPQAAPLLAPIAPELAETARAVLFEPCLAVALATDDPRVRAIPYDGVFVGRDGDQDLTWVARESSKPGRDPGERWVLHASAGFSRAHGDADPARVTDALIAAFAKVFGLPGVDVGETAFKRWKHARGGSKLEPADLLDRTLRVGLAGDWTQGGRIEAAYLSGRALAERLLDAP